MPESQIAMWCTVCGVRLTDDEIDGWGCPKCKYEGVPCAPDADVCVEINWHELHILCCWAENYANRVDIDAKVIHAIARRLQNQFPDFIQLTLSGEMAALPKELEDSDISVIAISSNIPKPPLIPVNGPGAVGHANKCD